jgi:regulator of protease activity HflC (stomatin/prohibitin superfamily)
MMIGPMVKVTFGVAVFLAMAFAALYWITFRVYVPPNSCAVLVRKIGRLLPPDALVATEPGQRGIQADALGPGRYFYNPLFWDYEIKPLLRIAAGDPKYWKWIHTLDRRQREELESGEVPDRGEYPQIGVVTRKVGKEPPAGQTVVSRASGYRGILAEVLTPGTYKINSYVYEVEIHPALVIPSGFVGVVTNLFGAQPEALQTPMLPELARIGPIRDSEPDSVRLESGEALPAGFVRPLAQTGQRGTQRDVLQPGVYFLNPKLQKVTIVEIGFNEYSQLQLSKTDSEAISFPSDTGFLIQLGVTVVWGIDPRHAAEVINEFGNVDAVMDKVIGPQLRSICRNIGSTYAARDFIQGEKREKFQNDLTAELQRVCRAKNLEVRLALVREIEVHAPGGTGGTGGDVTEDLKRTIQQSYVAKELELTKSKQRDAAAVRAQLEEERKKVDIARETIKADSRVLVANLLAEGNKQAAQIDAQAELEVATTMQLVAALEAQRIEILGQAQADVERMKKEAEATGYELLIKAFGGGQAYNLYTFAENFKPESIRLFFAGEGTFWTDLSRFQDLGSATMLQRSSEK